MGQVLALRQETSGTLFDLPPLTETMRAAADHDSLAQARHELHRAQDFGNEAELARWAERWGEGLLQTAGEGVDVADAEPEEVDTSDVKSELEEARARVDEVIASLKGPTGKLDLSSLLDAAEDCRRAVLKADDELEKL